MLFIYLRDKSLHRYKAICDNRSLHISIQNLSQLAYIPHQNIIFVLLIHRPGSNLKSIFIIRCIRYWEYFYLSLATQLFLWLNYFEILVFFFITTLFCHSVLSISLFLLYVVCCICTLYYIENECCNYKL